MFLALCTIVPKKQAICVSGLHTTGRNKKCSETGARVLESLKHWNCLKSRKRAAFGRSLYKWGWVCQKSKIALLVSEQKAYPIRISLHSIQNFYEALVMGWFITYKFHSKKQKGIKTFPLLLCRKAKSNIENTFANFLLLNKCVTLLSNYVSLHLYRKSYHKGSIWSGWKQ